MSFGSLGLLIPLAGCSGGDRGLSVTDVSAEVGTNGSVELTVRVVNEQDESRTGTIVGEIVLPNDDRKTNARQITVAGNGQTDLVIPFRNAGVTDENFEFDAWVDR